MLLYAGTRTVVQLNVLMELSLTVHVNVLRDIRTNFVCVELNITADVFTFKAEF